jgi:hypothetical protein
MNLSMKTTVTLMGLTLAPVVMALPTIYPKDISFLDKIENGTNSNVIADTESKNMFYVMPPNTGTSKVNGLHSITANVGFCKEMSDMVSYSRLTSARLFEIGQKEYEAQVRREEIIEKLELARKDAAEYVVANNLSELSDLDDQITKLDQDILDRTERMETCNENTCEELRSQLRMLKQDRTTTRFRRDNLSRQHRQALSLYNRKQAQVKNLQDSLKEATDEWVNLRERVLELRESYHNIYRSFSAMEGAQATIHFDSQWDQNVATLKDNNPGMKFNKIDTQNAVIMTSVADIKELPSTGSIMSFNMGGKFSQGQLNLPSYPENISGNIRLSLLGVCPMLHPQDFDISVPNSTEGMSFGLTASYEYPTAFTAKATATYNMHKIYQKIVNNKKKGGFFNSRTSSSVTEKTFFQDEFKVVWDIQDPSIGPNEAEREALENDWRHHIFARLAAVGLPANSNPGALVAPAVPKSGAAVLGNSLANNPQCKTNKYCAAATIGVLVLDAIFGNAKSTASYTNIQDVEMKEEWSRQSVVFKPYITSYK